MAQLSINVTGNKQVAVALERLRQAVGDDFTEPFQDVAQDLKEFTQGDVFDSEGSAAGQHWAELSEPYAHLKALQYPGKGLLEATGLLLDSFTSIIQSDSMLFTNTASYAIYHQVGTSKMPARPIFQVNEEVAALIGRAFEKHVERAIDQEWHGE